MSLISRLFMPIRDCCSDQFGAGASETGSETRAVNHTIALVGNPNCGKTTVFNSLTGAHQRVGNWAGVTVDRKEGSYRFDGDRIKVVDLPGVYSLSVLPGPESADERIGRDFILSGEADVVIDVIDATNLERNLYLTVQLLEMGVPLIVVLNMIDGARALGLEIDIPTLSRRLGCPVVPMVAARGEGVGELKATIEKVAHDLDRKAPKVDYGPAVEPAIARLSEVVGPVAGERGMDARWLSLKLLEGERLARRLTGGAADATLPSIAAEVERKYGESADVLIADGRYGIAHALAGAVLRRRGRVTRTLSDRIDAVVLGRWTGPVVFFGAIYLMFLFAINLGGAFIDFFDILVGTVAVDGVRAALTLIGSPEWLTVLLADGVGGGIQVVATFIPVIGFLYLFLSALEDSGYLSRAAFLADRFMRVVGLPGKAFVPLIIGFGCNVPAIMATRTLENPRERIVTVLMTPFMSCGARLAVYALFAAAFFPSGGQNIVFALYLLGILAALATGLLLRGTLLGGEATPFVMELPAYHLPRPRGLLIHTWNRLKSFIFGAGKIIVIVVAALTFLNSLGTDGTFGNENSRNSSLSAVGRAMVPVFEPMGITADNWPATVGIFTGVFAKEAVVGTLDNLYGAMDRDAAPAGAPTFDLLGGIGDALASARDNLVGLGAALTDPLGFGIVSGDAEELGVTSGTFGAMSERFLGGAGAFAYMLFILLYTPCAAALGAIVREIGVRWALFAAAWTTGLAWGGAVIAFQAGTAAAHPAASAAWIVGILVLLVAWVMVLRLWGHGWRWSRSPVKT